MLARILMVALALASASTQDTPGHRSGRSNTELVKLDQLFRVGHHEQYDRRQTPSYWAGTATRVHIQMYIRSFGSINPIQMDYAVDLYLRQRWLELRFLNNSLTRPLDLNDPILVKMLWKPEVYFPNSKDSDFQYVTLPNVMLRIHPDGTILYILRLKVTFSCMMDLASFPLDHQTCYIQLASFVKTTQELELVWYGDSPIKMYKRLTLPQFQLKEIKVDTCSQSFHIGNYSCLQAVLELQRNIGYHLVQSYLPTSLIVVVSWVSFWLDVDAIPSRVTLGVTTLLTVCSESASFRDNIPAVSYVKALDIWMGSCTTFVFLALVEFTVVSYIARHQRRFLFWGSVYGRPIPSLHHHRRPETPGKLSPGGECQSATHGPSYAVAQAAAPQADSHGAALTKHRDTSQHVYAATWRTTGGAGDSSNKSNMEGSDDADTRSNDDQVADFPDTGVLTPAADVHHDVTASGSQHTGQEDDSTPHGASATNIRHPHRDEDTCVPPPSDVGVKYLPSRWRQEVLLAKRIDRVCRVVFPAFFLLFNLLYWFYYQGFT